MLFFIEVMAIEEPKLEKHLGKFYQEYYERVPLFLPSWAFKNKRWGFWKLSPAEFSKSFLEFSAIVNDTLLLFFETVSIYMER